MKLIDEKTLSASFRELTEVYRKRLAAAQETGDRESEARAEQAMITVTECDMLLKKAQTVDAVPEDWLMARREEHSRDGFGWIYEEVLGEWEKEKEQG